MSPLRQPMSAALPLRGTGERTPDASVRAVRRLAPCDQTAPDRLSAPALPPSCLHRHHVDGLAPASMRLCSRGLRGCSPHVLQRAWHTLSLRRAPTAHRLPAVRSGAEGRRLLASAPPVHPQVSCTPVSRVGLRLPAALFPQGSDRAGPRLQGHGHQGQGATDRYVPRPAETRARLPTSWKTPRPTTWRLPATGRDHQPTPRAASPLRRCRVQGPCRHATQRAGMTTTGVALHPLRPAYATPRRAASVPPRLIPRALGHPPRDTPMGSLHRPHPGPAEASERLHALRHGLLPGPPAATSASPVRPSPWRALLPSPPRPAGPSVPSHRATAALRATASLRAPGGGDPTASILPGALGMAHRVRSLQRRRGAPAPWHPRCPGRPASSPAPALRR